MKVPTEICYDSKGEVQKWGYEIKDGDERLVLFKLLLDPTWSSTTSSILSRTVELIPKAKEPVDVVADYLSCLRRHTLHILQEKYGKVVLDTITIDCNLTVPAVRFGSLCRDLRIGTTDLCFDRHGARLQEDWPFKQL